MTWWQVADGYGLFTGGLAGPPAQNASAWLALLGRHGARMLYRIDAGPGHRVACTPSTSAGHHGSGGERWASPSGTTPGGHLRGRARRRRDEDQIPCLQASKPTISTAPARFLRLLFTECYVKGIDVWGEDVPDRGHRPKMGEHVADGRARRVGLHHAAQIGLLLFPLPHRRPVHHDQRALRVRRARPREF